MTAYILGSTWHCVRINVLARTMINVNACPIERRKKYLDDVAQETVSRSVGALDVGPAAGETELLRLEQEVRVLAACASGTCNSRGAEE